MTRVGGTGISGKKPYGPTWTTGAKQAENLQQQVQDELFGKKKPRELDADDTQLSAQLARLRSFQKKLARLAGDDEDDYRLVLAEGTIAMIDARGKVYVGKRFLISYADALEVQVGVLAHEIGHRPKRWAEYRSAAPRTRDELERLCRTEETYADYFAGRALAELGLQVEPLCRFLLDVVELPHAEYFPAALRVEVIKDGFADGRRKHELRKKMFPELAKRVSAKHDLGNG
ncbi:MAG: hypothetical protein A2138_16860 [Deltaproteobacteria bacterium RBG_16_71_12]|nr:MAG: hypothetical protein A2138_16860 [Deltaproteobacteria bacterium RBG_16_71_12]